MNLFYRCKRCKDSGRIRKWLLFSALCPVCRGDPVAYSRSQPAKDVPPRPAMPGPGWNAFPDVAPQEGQLVIVWARPEGELRFEPYFATYKGSWFRTSGYTFRAFRIESYRVAYWKGWLA